MTNYRAAGIASLLIACLTTSAYAQTTPPPTFTVTAGANTKELVFDWDPVPTAVIYRLLWKTEQGQYFEPYDEERRRRTKIALPIAVHLDKWLHTRFVVLACNPAGCTRSNEIAARDHMLDAIGYLKAMNTDPQDRFGGAVAISADGTTLAVAADGEDGGANLEQNNPGNVSTDSGAVYVFRRNARVWTQEAYLKAYLAPSDYRIGGQGVAPVRGKLLSLSANGSVLAVGAPHSSIATNMHEGSVLTFRRDANNVWTRDWSTVSPAPRANDFFGYNIDLSSDGLTLMAMSAGEPGAVGYTRGVAHLFTWSGSEWLHTASLPPYYPDDTCPIARLSANGKVLVRNCMNTAGSAMRAITQRLVGSTWVKYPDIATNWRGPQAIALNYDGTLLAIGYSGFGAPDLGIGVYSWINNRWNHDTTLFEPVYVPARNTQTFGTAIEFDRFGKYLAVGDPNCPAGGEGALTSTAASDTHGCVFVYERQAAGPDWLQRSMIKAPNPGANDGFGSSLALSGSAWYLAVGAAGEDSNATGIDGDRINDAAQDSGAVYLY